jgi:hypothetical protein
MLLFFAGLSLQSFAHSSAVFMAGLLPVRHGSLGIGPFGSTGPFDGRRCRAGLQLIGWRCRRRYWYCVGVNNSEDVGIAMMRSSRASAPGSPARPLAECLSSGRGARRMTLWPGVLPGGWGAVCGPVHDSRRCWDGMGSLDGMLKSCLTWQIDVPFFAD